MSVILFDKEKFLRVYQHLQLKGREIAYIWHYPENWDKPNGMDEHLKCFVEDLYQANIRCWNSQYPDDIQPIEKLKFRVVLPKNEFQLLKDLQGIRYNTYDNGGRQYNLPKTYERLNKLIKHILEEIVSKMPEYERARWVE